MSLLRRVLYLQALVWALAGVAAALAPGFVTETVLGHPGSDGRAWTRLLGVQMFTLALLLVLVAQRAEDLWWWSWAFVVAAAGTAAVATVHAGFGVAPGAAAWPWWTIGIVSWAFTFGLLWGLARTGIEHPPDEL